MFAQRANPPPQRIFRPLRRGCLGFPLPTPAMPQTLFAIAFWMTTRTLCVVVAALGVLLLGGCGGSDKSQFDVYLDELEYERALESVEEVPLGTYGSPVPSRSTMSRGSPTRHSGFTSNFQLVAIVDPHDERAVLAASKRHRGMLDDTIIAVCRKATREELEDSRPARSSPGPFLPG